MMVSRHGGAQRRRRCSAAGDRARARRGRESEHEKVSEHDKAPSFAHSGLMHGANAGVRTPSGGRGLWPVGHDGCCPSRFRWVKEPADRATSCTNNS